MNFQHSSGEEESAEGEQTGLALEAEHSGEEESAVEEQSGLALEAEQIIADEIKDCDMESTLQEIQEAECATKDNGITCDNPVQLVCDENTVKGRDGKVHEFEKLHVLEKGNERTQLVKESKLDESLRLWYKLAKQGNSMFAIVDGLLVKNVYDKAGDPMQVIAVPTSFRPRILHLAHEGSGHMGVKKCHSLISAKFIWPGMGKDISLHCKSCQVCQKCSKNGPRKAPLVIQPLYSIPFECCAFDIVGPLPKARGGYEYILTYICLATRWQEAIPLRGVSARQVAGAMVQIWTRTDIPKRVLTDCGPQFVSDLFKRVCKIFNIDKITTTPYHPECNGVLERMHGTLGSILTKARAEGLQWPDVLPMALHALRRMPNRSTGFAPCELVYGRMMRGPIDVLYDGWRRDKKGVWNTSEWVKELAKRLDCVRDIANENIKKEVRNRKKKVDGNKKLRRFKVGNLVWERKPGMLPKLSEGWRGPYTISEVLGEVNYRINGSGRKSRVVHVNTLKEFIDRDYNFKLRRVTVMADEPEIDISKVEVLPAKAEGFCERDLDEVLKDYGDVLSKTPGLSTRVKMGIDTGDHPPVGTYPYPVPDKARPMVEKEIEKLKSLGIIEPSTSAWTSPIVPIKKPDGSIRLCVDYRKLNAVTKPDMHYMPTFDDVVREVGASRVVSVLDLTKGYYQVEMTPKDQAKTTFASPFGKYQFLRVPFGLRNAPAIFQRLIEDVLRDCKDCCRSYIDDIVVYSNSWNDHLQHLRRVFECLKREGLTANPEKCVFGRRQLRYLGHIVGGGITAVPESKIKALRDIPRPIRKKQLRSFLGGIGYYRCYINGFASDLAELTPATAKGAPDRIMWSDAMVSSFKSLVSKLCKRVVLHVPGEADMLFLRTDASKKGVGCVLCAVNPDERDTQRPVAFYSAQLQGAQTRYSATELEALAIVKSIKHFNHILWGRKFYVVTDHKALTSLMSSKKLNNRLQGWVLHLQQYNFDIIYNPGEEQLDADMLSRLPFQEGDPAESSQRSLVLGGGDVGPTPPPGCRDEGLLAQNVRGVRGAVRTDGVADHSSERGVVVKRSGI